MCVWVLDLVETLFGEEGLLPGRALRVSGSRVKGRQHLISDASIVPVLAVDDCLLLSEEGGQLAEHETSETDVLREL